MRAAAIVPTPPLLVPEVAGGSAAQYDALRAACDQAVAAIVAADPPEVVVVGAAATTGDAQGSWDWRGFGVLSPAEPVADRLPLALGIGAWLLDRAGWTGGRRYLGVGADATPETCAGLGRALGQEACLVVCGDGAATLDEKAPGHVHREAPAWEAAAVEALASGDPDLLMQLSPELSSDVLASGRAPWQVLAGAASGTASPTPWEASLLHSSSPHGVGYHVLTWLTPYRGETKNNES